MDYTGTEVHAWREEGAPVTRPVGVLDPAPPKGSAVLTRNQILPEC